MEESIRQAKAIVSIEDVNITEEDQEMAEQCISGECAIGECLPPLTGVRKHPYGSFDDYFVPHTELLENRFKFRSNDDQSALETLTGRSSFLRIALLLAGKEEVETRHFSLEVLQQIHTYLFQDAYPWAGMVRTFGMRKGDCSFCPSEYIQQQGRYIADLFGKAGQWGNMDKGQFASTITKLFNHVDDLHPFREGNGRTQRTFFLLFSRHEGWNLDYTLFSPQAQVEASIKALFGDEKPLHDQFYAMAKRMERDKGGLTSLPVRLDGARNPHPGDRRSRIWPMPFLPAVKRWLTAPDDWIPERTHSRSTPDGTGRVPWRDGSSWQTRPSS